jgi:YHS domain-containing protein
VEVDDVLVQDPVCETYIAQRSGIPLEEDGKVIYFCSEACRNRYLESRSNEHHS